MKKVFFMVLALILVFVSVMPAFSENTAGAMLPNPWKKTDADSILNTLGLRFAVPDNAENVVYFTMESASLAEMRFMLDGVPCIARIAPAEGFEDISGLHFNWLEETECDFNALRAVVKTAQDAKSTYSLCLWYDAVPGLMYSVSAISPEKTDILKIADAVYVPAQGECAGDDDLNAISVEEFIDLFNALTGYEGTAGASLKEASAAFTAVCFAVDNEFANQDASLYYDSIGIAFTALDDARREELLVNLPAQKAFIDRLLSGDEDALRIISDTAVPEIIELVLSLEDARAHANALYAAFDILFTPVG